MPTFSASHSPAGPHTPELGAVTNPPSISGGAPLRARAKEWLAPAAAEKIVRHVDGLLAVVS